MMLLPITVSCFSEIQIGFTFLVPTHPGSPGQRPLNGCVSYGGLRSWKQQWVVLIFVVQKWSWLHHWLVVEPRETMNWYFIRRPMSLDSRCSTEQSRSEQTFGKRIVHTGDARRRAIVSSRRIGGSVNGTCDELRLRLTNNLETECVRNIWVHFLSGLDSNSTV